MCTVKTRGRGRYRRTTIFNEQSWQNTAQSASRAQQAALHTLPPSHPSFPASPTAITSMCSNLRRGISSTRVGVKALLRGQKENENEPEGRQLTINIVAYVTLQPTLDVNRVTRMIIKDYYNGTDAIHDAFIPLLIFKSDKSVHHGESDPRDRRHRSRALRR
ncbi:hypothetical protein J6590_040769 [Homalodisca vitripennis]|nr:hypothetical protein J6590_040769 [Homalodisca vitripennis]